MSSLIKGFNETQALTVLFKTSMAFHMSQRCPIENSMPLPIEIR